MGKLTFSSTLTIFSETTWQNTQVLPKLAVDDTLLQDWGFLVTIDYSKIQDG